jgi:hypothetical protein
MPQACCSAARDEEVCDTRTSEGPKARMKAGTSGPRMIGCSQVSIGVGAVRLVLQLCEQNDQLKHQDPSSLKLERQVKTRMTQESVPKLIQIVSKGPIELAGFQKKMSTEQGNTGEQRILTGNVSRLLESNTNSPMSLTKCSIDVLCGACARTVCSYSGLYKSSPIDELDGRTEEGDESRRKLS